MAGDGLGPRAVVAQQGGEAGGEGNDAGVLAGPGGVGACCGVLIVIQQSGGGLVAVLVRVQAPSEGAGVLPDQVVHPVAALGRLSNQVLVIQGFQAAAGCREIGAVQGGGG